MLSWPLFTKINDLSPCYQADNRAFSSSPYSLFYVKIKGNILFGEVSEYRKLSTRFRGRSRL